MTKEKIILAESDEAAKYVTGISGWVDRHGYFHGKSEESARYCSSTHKRCEECKIAIIRRGYRYCADCKEKKDIERYSKLEKKIWDGESYLYSDKQDMYFADYQELYDYLSDNEEGVSSTDSLRLIICEPAYLRDLDADYWTDDLPEDAELPDSVLSAIDTLNSSLKDAGVVSWSPGKYAAIINK
jgi:hypothetical protein